MRELLFDKAIPSSLAINANHLPNPSDGYHFTVGQFAVGSRSMSGCVGEMLLMQIVNDDKTHTQQVFEIQSNGSFLHKTVSQSIIKLHGDASFLGSKLTSSKQSGM